MEKSIRVLILGENVFRNYCLAVFAAFTMLFALSLPTVAQVTTANIVGTVSDPSGGQVPAASITARNIDTGLTRTVVSGDDGSYRIEFLPVGRYTIEVTPNSGFKRANREGIVLQVNDTARVDFNLEVGSVNEEVTVNTAPPEVNTSNGELGRTVESQEITSLPLVERNVYALLDLTPGVQSNNTGVTTASTSTSNLSLGFPEQRTLINGGTDGGTGSVNYYLDGGINMTNLRNTGNIAPNPEAIQEFKVTTNGYSAEYGRFASGIINIITKSGTNQYHGSLYEFVRNDAFNANDYGSVIAKAPYHRNQFGGSIGGPLPFFNFGEGGRSFTPGKDRTFFFFTYSGLRQVTNTFLNNAIVPSDLERVGNFSQSATKPKDPRTGTTLANATAFSGGVIPTARLDPVALRIINTYIPRANLPGNKWQGNVSNPYNTDEYLTKIDHQLTKEHRLSFSYFTTAGITTVFPGSGNLPWATQDYKWRQHNVNLSDVWVISPDKVNQVWFTFTRNFGGRLNVPSTTLGDLGSSFATQGTGSLPQITVSGFFTLSNAIGGPTAGTNLYSVRDTLSLNKGSHSLKLGGEISLNKDIQQTLLNNYGVFTFNNTASGNALADFLLGVPSAVTQDAPVTGYTNTWYTSLFAQDDWRVNSKLTLNLGVRYEIQTPPTDPLNRFVNYIPGQKSTVNPLAPVGALFYGDSGVERGGIPTKYNHFSPRVGFAYDPFGDGRTSIRGAFGMFYGSLSGNEWNTMTNFQPFSTRLTLTNTNRTGTGATLVNPYANYVGGNPFPYNGTFTNGGGFFAVDPNFQFPRTYQANISVQRQVTNSLTLGAAYVRNAARNLPFGRDVNAPVATSTATTAGANVLARRPNPAFGAVNVLSSDQKADYSGLQITGSLRLNKIVNLNSFYTLSKTTSSAELFNNTTQGLAQNYYDLAAEQGAADTDQRHIFSLSMVFRPDFYKGDNRFVGGIINGWNISPIIKIRSGRPFTVTNGNVDANLDGVTGTDRARLIGDPHLDNPTAGMWFNINAFAQNAVVNGVAVDGNSPRNFLYGPGYRTLDLAVTRSFNLGERFKISLRGEGTNVLNNVNLGQPNSSVTANVATATNFGTIRTANAMRILQFGMRLTF